MTVISLNVEGLSAAKEDLIAKCVSSINAVFFAYKKPIADHKATGPR